MLKPVLWLGACLVALNAAAQAPDQQAGKLKAAAACALCHGPLGMSAMPAAPNLAGQVPVYLEEQLKNYRSGKRHHEIMSVIAKPLSDQDIANLVAWYSSVVVQVSAP
jgi:cytochrome c553